MMSMASGKMPRLYWLGRRCKSSAFRTIVGVRGVMDGKSCLVGVGVWVLDLVFGPVLVGSSGSGVSGTGGA